jgi:hypothetical protein
VLLTLRYPSVPQCDIAEAEAAKDQMERLMRAKDAETSERDTRLRSELKETENIVAQAALGKATLESELVTLKLQCVARRCASLRVLLISS